MEKGAPSTRVIDTFQYTSSKRFLELPKTEVCTKLMARFEDEAKRTRLPTQYAFGAVKQLLTNGFLSQSAGCTPKSYFSIIKTYMRLMGQLRFSKLQDVKLNARKLLKLFLVAKYVRSMGGLMVYTSPPNTFEGFYQEWLSNPINNIQDDPVEKDSSLVFTEGLECWKVTAFLGIKCCAYKVIDYDFVAGKWYTKVVNVCVESGYNEELYRFYHYKYALEDVKQAILEEKREKAREERLMLDRNRRKKMIHQQDIDNKLERLSQNREDYIRYRFVARFEGEKESFFNMVERNFVVELNRLGVKVDLIDIGSKNFEELCELLPIETGKVYSKTSKYNNKP